MLLQIDSLFFSSCYCLLSLIHSLCVWQRLISWELLKELLKEEIWIGTSVPPEVPGQGQCKLWCSWMKCMHKINSTLNEMCSFVEWNTFNYELKFSSINKNPFNIYRFFNLAKLIRCFEVSILNKIGKEHSSPLICSVLNPTSKASAAPFNIVSSDKWPHQ